MRNGRRWLPLVSRATNTGRCGDAAVSQSRSRSYRAGSLPPARRRTGRSASCYLAVLTAGLARV